YDVASLTPEIVLAGAGILLLLLEAFLPGLRRGFTGIALAATAAAAWGLRFVPMGASWDGALDWSAATRAFTVAVLLSTGICLLASQSYLRRERILAGEYHALLLWSACGAVLLLRATELLTVFLALELLSICLYALAAFHRRIQIGTEAAIKYFLMGAFVSAFVLFGIALLYGETGSTRLDQIGAAFSLAESFPVVPSLGILLLLAGFGFKLSLVPFHAWSPDAYQGAPTPFVAFLSVAPKVASAMVFLRVLEAASLNPSHAGRWSDVVAALAVASMIAGNLLALVQRDIKRMLAYSGIAHMGYLMLALVVPGADSVGPVAIYLISYVLMTAGAFAVVSQLYAKPGEQHIISDLAGWGYRYPLLGACLSISMLSLAGIPPTLGFFGKYLVFLNAVGDGRWGLAVVGVLASLVGVAYYLRVIYTLYMRPAARPDAPVAADGLLIDVWGRAAALLAALLTLALGLWPARLLDWVLGVPWTR
ncbi:MAG TPA: NADH-quinone oxidoreductase subunit N, partial [Thermoanaerobaculia bacterium]|nr:NADH-quinone oxidoreductase subunit N [Thermoanaerobaculia bacterium]